MVALKHTRLAEMHKLKDLTAIKKAWERFFSKSNGNSIDTVQNFFTDKFYTPYEICLECPPNLTSRQKILEFPHSDTFWSQGTPIYIQHRDSILII